MQQRYNNLVTFVRNGVAIPALVVNSQLQADGREFLSLLYADPFSGPQLVIAGASRKVGDVALSVPPLSAGAGFGWFDLPVADAHAALLDDHAGALAVGALPPTIDPVLVGTPGIHVPIAERQALESDSDRDSRLKNLAFQHPPTLVVPKDVFDKERAEADGSGTGRYGEGDNWTQTGDGTDYPGSYGVGPELKVGDPIRVIEADGSVNPNVSAIVKVTTESPDGMVVFIDGGDPNGYVRDRVVRVPPAMKPFMPSGLPAYPAPGTAGGWAAEAENARIAKDGGGKGPQASQQSVPQEGGIPGGGTYPTGTGGYPGPAPLAADAAFGPVQPGDPNPPHAIPGGVESDVPAYEVKTYSDGTVASGPGPMPGLSPAQQDAAEKSTL
jgi:hypothetical protein